MSEPQVAAYKPKPITQRDGSQLQNSNCRMASIACGLDYDTKGRQTSTGAVMRSYTDDQEGGTDSGDAKQSWLRGYEQNLTVRDGSTFDVLLADLRRGCLVHIDVWHAAVGPPTCLSGGGGYGHTMAVLPDFDGAGWLVSDPWCKPPKWVRVSEEKLQRGAEEWGRRIYGETGGVTEPEVVRRAVKLLMSRSRPERERNIPLPAETGGPKRILFTITRAIAPSSEEDMGDNFLVTSPNMGLATVINEGGTDIMPTGDGTDYHLTKGYQREVNAYATITSGQWKGYGGLLVKVPGREETGLVLARHCTVAAPAVDHSARDAEWEKALKHGDPWPSEVG